LPTSFAYYADAIRERRHEDPAGRSDARGISAPFLAKGESSGKVKGGFLVAPPSAKVLAGFDALDPAFLTPPGEPLPFPSIVIASRDDPFASFAESEALARTLGAELIDAGFSGHINSESGHGPWPEGVMRFAGFLKTL
jgi:hypothetical protein